MTTGAPPQTYYAQQYAAPPVYKSLSGRVLAVEIAFGLIVVVSVIAVVSDAFQVSLLDRMLAQTGFTASEVSNNDARQAFVGLFQSAAFLAGVVTFIMWLYRAYGNVDYVEPQERRYDRGWAIGGWFVPIWAFFRPVQVVNDVWRAGGWPKSSALIAFWWAAWIGGRVIAIFNALGSGHEDTTQAYRDSAVAGLVNDILILPAAVLAVLVVIKATRRLDARAAETPPPAPQPPSQRFRQPWTPTDELTHDDDSPAEPQLPRD